MIHVRLFAALSDAAGVDRLDVEAVSVRALRAQLTSQFGPTFGARLEQSRAWVDGDEVDEDAPLPDGVEVALLPPFAGG